MFQWETDDRRLIADKDGFYLQNFIQTSSGAYEASYPMSSGAFPLKVKVAGAWSIHAT